MSKRLMIVLALAFVVGIACSAYAEVQNVKVGGDITTLAFDRYRFNLSNIDVKDQVQGLAAIANVKVNADLTDAVAVSIVLRNEKVWGKTSSSSTTYTDDGRDDVVVTTTGQNADLNEYLAAAYVTMKEFAGQPLTLKIGQMGVKLGNGMIVGDPNTNQSSAGPFNYELADYCPRVAFTGGVAIWDMKPLVLTLGALKVTETNLHTNRDDVNTYMANAAFDIAEMTGLNKAIVEVYDVLEDNYDDDVADQGDVNNIGVRADLTPMENVGVGGEFAYQTQQNDSDRDDNKSMSDRALMLNVNVGFPDVAMAPVIGADFAHFSSNWDPMYESLTPADIANVLFPNQNVQLIGLSAGLKPMDDVGLKLRYANLRLAKAFTEGDTVPTNWNSNDWTMTSKKDLGNELDAYMTYDYTSDVQFGLKLGYFKPGKAFHEDNRKTAHQVIGSMKVTF